MNFNRLIKHISFSVLTIASLIATSCKKEATLSVNYSDKFEGKTIELMNYSDSTLIDSKVITNGKAEFTIPSDSEMPQLTVLMIDGRARAYYVMEEGKALLTDSMSVASGTPVNAKFSEIMHHLDSIENLDDTDLYQKEVMRYYNENKENVLGEYFGIEWIKYANPASVDSLVAIASPDLVNSKRGSHYIRFARLRAATSPGAVYKDFSGENVAGKKQKLSTLVEPGKYTLIDFWASWCPYCIKELPDLSALYTRFHDKNFNIVGVAVRDTHEDTSDAVAKYDIQWPILYNTGKTPYDIYGFSGIPYHILIGPDGKIISAGESVSQIEQRLESIL